MRLLVSGGRNYQDRPHVYEVLDALRIEVECLIHGDEPNGLDGIAKDWAIDRAVDQMPFPADWDRYGRSLVGGY